MYVSNKFLILHKTYFKVNKMYCFFLTDTIYKPYRSTNAPCRQPATRHASKLASCTSQRSTANLTTSELQTYLQSFTCPASNKYPKIRSYPSGATEYDPLRRGDLHEDTNCPQKTQDSQILQGRITAYFQSFFIIFKNLVLYNGLF